MSLDRPALEPTAYPSKSSLESRHEPGRRGALAFVRHNAASWRGFRMLERSVLEGALALTRQGRGQTLFAVLHGLHSLADRRLDALEIKGVNSGRPFGLIRDLLGAAIARPDARLAASKLPAGVLAALQTSAEPPESDPSSWPTLAADFLASLPTRAPLMIVLEHVHHADADSLRALEALARRVATARILLVVPCRIDVAPNAHLDSVRRELLEARLARSIVVSSPQADAARLMFQAAFGRSARPEAAAASIGEDDAGLLIYGLTAVEACRRAGRWSDAKTLAERIVDVGEAHQAPYVTCSAGIALGHLLADQGKWDESLERLEHIQPAVENLKEDDLIAWLYWGLARVHWGRSDRRRAFQMLRLAQAVGARAADASLNASIALCGVEWLADNRRVRAAHEWLDSIEWIAKQTDRPDVTALCAAANGVVALAQNDAIAATGYFRAALRHWTDLRHGYALARTRLRLASALLARDNSDSRREGREELSDAHTVFTRLGAASDVSAVEAIGAQYGVRPRARRASSGGSASPGGITPREREVLELLVRGMTNRQIAGTLSITEKTAEGHVSNILAKLGVASRGQAAGYAVANGLLETAEA